MHRTHSHPLPRHEGGLRDKKRCYSLFFYPLHPFTFIAPLSRAPSPSEFTIKAKPPQRPVEKDRSAAVEFNHKPGTTLPSVIHIALG